MFQPISDVKQRFGAVYWKHVRGVSQKDWCVTAAEVLSRSAGFRSGPDRTHYINMNALGLCTLNTNTCHRWWDVHLKRFVLVQIPLSHTRGVPVCSVSSWVDTNPHISWIKAYSVVQSVLIQPTDGVLHKTTFCNQTIVVCTDLRQHLLVNNTWGEVLLPVQKLHYAHIIFFPSKCSFKTPGLSLIDLTVWPLRNLYIIKKPGWMLWLYECVRFINL